MQSSIMPCTVAPQPHYGERSYRDSLLVLIRINNGTSQLLIDQARKAIRDRHFGAEIFSSNAKSRRSLREKASNSFAQRIFNNPELRSSLLTFPVHETLGNIALELLAQNFPISALNLIPLWEEEEGLSQIDGDYLLLAIPAIHDSPRESAH